MMTSDVPSTHKRKQPDSYGSRAEDEFEAIWRAFKLAPKAFAACQCVEASSLCSCFMQHEAGRARFAKHQEIWQHLRKRKQLLEMDLDRLQHRLFRFPSFSVPDCKCHTSYCACIRDPKHPMYEHLQEAYDLAKTERLTEWNDKLIRYKLPLDAETNPFYMGGAATGAAQKEAKDEEKEQKAKLLISYAEEYEHKYLYCQQAIQSFSTSPPAPSLFSPTSPSWSAAPPTLEEEEESSST